MMIVKVGALKSRRVSKNLSRHGLSRAAGLSGNAVLRIESGKHKVHPLRAKAIAEALGCDVFEIFELAQKGA